MSRPPHLGENPSAVGAGTSRDPRVWRPGLAAARQALRAAGVEEAPSDEPGKDPPEPVENKEKTSSREGVVERARRIAAWVNGVGDPAQFDDRR